MVKNIGIDKENGNYLLEIEHDLNWSNEDISFKGLKYKVDEIIKLIESGEIYKTYPEIEEKKLEIKVYIKHKLTKIGLERINDLYIAIGKKGVSLSYEYK